LSRLASLGNRVQSQLRGNRDRRRKVAGDADPMGQAFTFAIGPALFGVTGRFVDTALATSPLFVVIGIVVGCLGSGATLWYRYQARMETLEADKPWRRLAHAAGEIATSEKVRSA
jgi:F0F1-type ATP synthase assembly protein I